MSHERICDDCWCSFTTDYNNVRLCWDCQRVRLIKEHPEVALHDEKLSRLAFDNGLKIEQMPDGSAKVSNLFEYEDHDEQWREDLNKIVMRHKNRRGRRPDPGVAWNIAARAAAKRAAAKHPSQRVNLMKRKGDGYVGV